MKLFSVILSICFLLTGCAIDSEQYRTKTPSFEFESFFKGNLCAKGLVKSRNGQINRKFAADIVAYSSANHVRLEEVFLFDDGERQNRDWFFDKTPEGWIGKAGDVVGIANGEVFGDSLHLNYQLKINVDKSEYIVAMDDWLTLIDSSTLMGSTEITKWGVNLGRIDIVIQKKDMIQKDINNVRTCIEDRVI
tara:strand:+ start:6870 stop:7445 length:576 start_codon:yes stop_codon:yes gene_type:complete